MKKLLIDIDDVICYSSFLGILNEFLGTNYVQDDFKVYEFQSILSKKDKNKFYEFLNTKNMYEKVTFLPNCKAVIKKLSQKYEIFICSDCTMDGNYKHSGKIFCDKYNFLIKTFPYLNPENFIFTGSKNVVCVDVAIDDKLSNLQGDVKEKLMMTAYHNKEISDKELKKQNVKRVSSWKEIEKILIK